MRWAGHAAERPTAIAACYAGLIDGLVADERADGAAGPADRHAHGRRRRAAAASPPRRCASPRALRRMTRRRPRPLTFAILPVKRFGARRRASATSCRAARAARSPRRWSPTCSWRCGARRPSTRCCVVTSEPAAEAIGRGYGANVLVDDREDGQSAADADRHRARDRGRARRASCSCPATARRSTRPSSTRCSTARRRAARSSIVPDRHGTGTNALLLTPPDVIEPAFGPDSRARHEQAAAAAGVPCDGRARRDAGARRRHRRRPRGAAQALANRRGGAAHTRGMLSRLAGTRAAPVDRRLVIVAAALPGIPEVRRRRRPRARCSPPPRGALADGDVLVVAHKVVSKAEGRVVALADVQPGERARALGRRARQGPARSSRSSSARARRSCARGPGVLICRTHHGFVCANAGVDASNARAPASSSCCRATPTPRRARCAPRLRELTGVAPAIVIADSFGRAWRVGQCDVAIGDRRAWRRSRTGAGAADARGPRARGDDHRRRRRGGRGGRPRAPQGQPRAGGARARPRAPRQRRRRPGRGGARPRARRGPVPVSSAASRGQRLSRRARRGSGARRRASATATVVAGARADERPRDRRLRRQAPGLQVGLGRRRRA